MFDRIILRPGSSISERYLSIADLVDMMFYYREVHVVVSQFELKQLLTIFGEDILFELIASGRLYVHPCDQHIGAARYGIYDSVGLFKRNFRSIDELLLNFHKQYNDDHNENVRFTQRFSKILEEYVFPTQVQDSLYHDVEDEGLLTEATKVFIRQYYPSYQGVDKIQVQAKPTVSSFMSFFKIDGNLRLDELKALHQQLGYGGDFSYSTVLMSIGETLADCYMASDLNAEIITNQRWSEVYKLRMNTYISQAEQSADNIDHFKEMVSNEFYSPGQSFIAGIITPYQLLDDLNSTNSINFREWLSKLPSEQPITGELYKEIQTQNSNKWWVKLSRVFTQIAAGIINPIAGIGLTFMDGFVGDRIVNGWTPNIFVSKMLQKDEYKKS